MKTVKNVLFPHNSLGNIKKNLNIKIQNNGKCLFSPTAHWDTLVAHVHISNSGFALWEKETFLKSGSIANVLVPFVPCTTLNNNWSKSLSDLNTTNGWHRLSIHQEQQLKYFARGHQ